RIRITRTIATAWNRTRLHIQDCDCSPVTSLPEAMAITPRTRTYTTAAMASSNRIIRIGVMVSALPVAKCETKRKLAGKQVRGELGPIRAACAHRCKRRRKIALGEATAILVGDKRVVAIGGLGKVEQPLQEALDRRRRAEVRAAHHDRHAALRVV